MQCIWCACRGPIYPIIGDGKEKKSSASSCAPPQERYVFHTDNTRALVATRMRQKLWSSVSSSLLTWPGTMRLISHIISRRGKQFKVPTMSGRQLDSGLRNSRRPYVRSLCWWIDGGRTFKVVDNMLSIEAKNDRKYGPQNISSKVRKNYLSNRTDFYLRCLEPKMYTR